MRMPGAYELNYGASRGVKVSVAERFTRAGLAGWLPFLAIGLALVGTSVALWAYNNTLVAWALSQGMVDEGATRTLPSSLRHASVAGAVLGVTALSLAPPGVRHGIAIVARYLRVAASTIALDVGALLRYLWLGIAIVARYLWLTISILLRYAWQVLSAIVRPFWLGVIAITGAVGVALGYLRACVSTITRYSRLGVSGAFKLLVGLAAVLVLIPLYYAGTGISSFLRHARPRVATASRYAGLRVSTVALAVGTLLHYLWLGIAIVARHLRLAVSIVARQLWLALSTVAVAVGALLRYLWLGIAIVARHLRLAVSIVARYLRVATSTIALDVEALLRYLWLGVATTLGYLWLGLSAIAVAVGALLPYLRLSIAIVARHLWVGLSAIAAAVGALLRYLWLGVTVVARHVWLGLYTITVAVGALLYLWLGARRAPPLGVSTVAVAVGAMLGYLWIGIAIVARHLWLGVSTTAVAVGAMLGYLWIGIAIVARHLWLGVSTTAVAVGTLLRYLWLGVSTVAMAVGTLLRYLWLGVTVVAGHLWLGVSTIAVAVGPLLRYLWLGVTVVARHVWLGVSTTAVAVGLALRYLGRSGYAALGYLALGVSTISRPMRLGLWNIAHYARMGVSTAAVTLVWALGGAGLGMSMVLRGLGSTPSFAMRTVSTGSSTVPDVLRFGVRLATPRKAVSSMSELNLTRERVLSLIATIWIFGIVGLILGAVLWPAPPEPRVVVAHWATGHLTRDGLLKDMAKEFNKAGHRIGGTRVVVEVYDAPSELQGKYLSELLGNGTRRDLHKETNGYVVKNIPDPTIVTPSSAHWLVTTNYEVGRAVVDLDAAESIVRPVIGIVTYEEMAKCLGWPEKKIGFADIIALRNDPLGWERYPCARAEWGRRPLLAFTDPTTSSTGRSLHLALYSFAANKPPEDLTVGDVNDPEVVAYVKEFQGLIDHYLIGTTVLNTKIHQGPRYGHFFIMPEDNLIHLYEGTEKSYVNGIKTTAPPIEKRMVMIYPKEGSMPRKNCACIVQAHWVSEEQVEASQQWIDFIREDEQQRAFMAAGFRPGTDLALNFPGSKISSEFGLNPEEPTIVLNPSMTRPDVAAAIDQNWEQVKRPGIVTVVVDTSGSMMGTKIAQAKNGLIRALDTMARNNQVGLVTFDDAINTRVPVAPLAESRFEIAEAAEKMRARGETALYDAIKAAIEMTDAAAPGDRDAIRGVVVLTDGLANRGAVRLDDLI